MIERIEKSFLSLSPHGFHRIVYHQWGDEHAQRTLLCVHGLTRNGRDFDQLAQSLADQYRVVCPDMPGRGLSEWLTDPQDYSFPTYLTALCALIARLEVTEIDWLGTSMGGLLGMMVASQANHPIRKLVINDVGPVLEAAGLQRINNYIGQDPLFKHFEELEHYIRQVSAPFGKLSAEQWRQLAQTSARRLPDGRYGLAYDPAIAVPFHTSVQHNADLWPVWDTIRIPVLLLRGEQSDLISPNTAKAMTERGPRVQYHEFPGVGHAPALMNAEQIGIIRRFLFSS